MTGSIYTNNHQIVFRLLLFFFLSSFVFLYGQEDRKIIEKIQNLRSASDYNPENREHILLLTDLANAYSLTKIDTFEILTEEIQELSKKSNYKEGECKVLLLLVNFYIMTGNIEQAETYCNDILDISQKHNLYRNTIDALNLLGLIQSLQGNNAKALIRYLKALKIAEEIKDYKLITSLTINIGRIYYDTNDFETAKLFFEKSLQNGIKDNDQDHIAVSEYQLSRCEFMENNFTLADSLLNRSIPFFERTPNMQNGLVASYNLKGLIKLEFGKYNEAIGWFNKSNKTLAKINKNASSPEAQRGLAAAYLKKNNLVQSERNALNALKGSSYSRMIGEKIEANAILSQIYRQKGQLKKSLQYLDEHIRLYKQASSEDFQTGLGVLRSKMLYEKEKEQLIEDNKRAVAKQKLYTLLSMVGILILLIIIGLIYRTIKIQNRYTAALQKRKKELKEANETKNKLFSVIAHDLRGPINSFYSLMKLYLDDGFSKEESKFIFPKALQEIQSISQMLNNLLSWAKSQMGGNTLKRTSTPIFLLAQESIQLLQPLADKKKIGLSNEIDESVFGYIDRNFIDVVFRNLISNAIKFSAEGGQIVLTSKAQEEFIELAVKDTGVGMEKATLKTLFVKNMTHSTHGTNHEKGTGLGLILCNEMVTANGGSIWVESIKDEGSTFYFTVPKNK